MCVCDRQCVMSVCAWECVTVWTCVCGWAAFQSIKVTSGPPPASETNKWEREKPDSVGSQLVVLKRWYSPESHGKAVGHTCHDLMKLYDKTGSGRTDPDEWALKIYSVESKPIWELNGESKTLIISNGISQKCTCIPEGRILVFTSNISWQIIPTLRRNGVNF